MPEWFAEALGKKDDAQAAIEFAKRFLKASLSEREAVKRSWNASVEWALPNPWRLACHEEDVATAEDRIRTVLLFQALGFGGADEREAVMGFAVVHNSCVLAGVHPKATFEEVASAVGGLAADALRAFAARDSAEQSLDAFGLEAVANRRGGFELKCHW